MAPFVVEVISMIEELFESPFHSNVFPEELHTVLKETFGEIQTPQIIRILDLPLAEYKLGLLKMTKLTKSIKTFVQDTYKKYKAEGE